jgi:hypothetical protein
MQPSEIENLPFYEFEITLEELNELLKQKSEAEQRASKGQGPAQNSPGSDAAKYMGMASKITSGIKMPSFSMPKR